MAPDPESPAMSAADDVDEGGQLKSKKQKEKERKEREKQRKKEQVGEFIPTLWRGRYVNEANRVLLLRVGCEKEGYWSR